MADQDKVYTPTIIAEIPFPLGEAQDSTSSQTTGGGNYSPEKIVDQPFPDKRVAIEVLSSALNTKSKRILQEFQFTQSGALQIGDYQAGVSGDIRISPNGIVARDSSGSTTFALDGETGDATFAGTIQAGAIITGQVIVGNNNVIIDGENRRIIVNDGTYDRVLIGYQQNGF